MKSSKLILPFIFIMLINSVCRAAITEPHLEKTFFSEKPPTLIAPAGFAVKLTLGKSECTLGEKIQAVFEIQNITSEPKRIFSTNMFQDYLFIIRDIDTREEYHASNAIRIHSGMAIYTTLLKPNETFKRNYALSMHYGLKQPGIYEITYIWPLGEGPDTEMYMPLDEKLNIRTLKDVYPDIVGYPKRIVTNTVLLEVTGDTENLIQKVKDNKKSDVSRETMEAPVKINKPTIESLIAALKKDDGSVRACAVEVLGNMGNSAVESLIMLLKDEKSYVQEGAVDALGRIGTPAVNPLIAALKDENCNVRKNAAEALGKIGDASAVRPLIAVLDDQDEWVRAKAAEALGEIKDARVVEPLIAVLKDKSSLVRRFAASALEKIQDPRTVEPFIACLEDEDESVRACSVSILGKMKDPRAIEPLIVSLKDENEFVRHNVLWALIEVGEPAVDSLLVAMKGEDRHIWKSIIIILGRIDDSRAVEPLIVALQDEEPGIRRYAAKALGKLRDTRAVEPLISVLEDEVIYVRREVALALGEIKDPRAVEPLIAAMNNNELCVRMNAVKALGQIKDIRAIDPLIGALKEENTDVLNRVNMVARALREIGKPAMEPLITTLKNEDAGARWVTAEVLGEIKDPRAVEPLIAALKDNDSGVRWNVARALKNIIGEDFGEDQTKWQKWWKENRHNFLKDIWGDEKDGLRLHIKSDKIDYHSKDEIQITGYVKNISDAPIVLPRFSGLDYPKFKKGSLNVLTVGSYDRLIPIGAPLNCIRPGQIKVYHVKHKISESMVGNILVTCTFGAKKDDETVEVWEGRIDSNGLSIRVIKK